jgi:hypothetical protein
MHATPLRQRGLLSGLVLAVIVLLYVINHQAFLVTAEKADRAVAGTIATVTPGALTESFAARTEACDYHWLVFCEARTKPCLSPLAKLCDLDVADHDSLWAQLDWDSDQMAVPDFVSPAWNAVRFVAAMPDATWHALTARYHEGVIVFGLLLVFVVLNLALAVQTPPICWPVTLPVSALVASCLFWVVQHMLLWAADGVGLVIEILLLAAFLPHAVLALLHHLGEVKDVAEVADKAHDVSDMLKLHHGAKDAAQGR